MRFGTLIRVLALLCCGSWAQAQTWAPLAKQGTQFTLTETACIRYGIEPDWSPCVQKPAGVIWCTDNEFTEPPATRGRFDKGCEKLVTTPAVAELACVPSNWFSFRFPEGDASLPHPHGFTYACDDGKRFILLYSDAERDDFLAKAKSGQFKSSSDVAAWRRAQPAYAYTAAESAFIASIAAQYAPVCKITAQSATAQDRQVYRPTVDGLKIGTAITGVRIAAGTIVPCFAPIGNYYNVAGLKDTQGRVIAGGFAIGAVQ